MEGCADGCLWQKLLAAFQAFECRNNHLVKIQPSWREAHADGLYIADRIPKSELAKQLKGEIGHIQRT